jgi:hypothetical protein
VIPQQQKNEEEGVARATQAATLQLNPASEGTQPEREGGRSDKPQPSKAAKESSSLQQRPPAEPAMLTVSVG